MSRPPALLSRLVKVEALRRGATTPGEREAAERAQARLTTRIEAEKAARAPAPEVELPSAAMPEDAMVRAVLGRWEEQRVDDRELHRWARAIVDRVVLPRDPADPTARRAELILALAGPRLSGLKRADLPAILGFLDGGEWTAWFDLLVRADRGRRRLSG